MKILDDEKDKLMDHEYDGIRELDNHMPTWWLWMFYVSIIISVVYLFYYAVTGWGLNQHEQYKAEVAAAEQLYGSGEEEKSQQERYDWTLLTSEQALEEGKAIYLKQSQLCFTCHGKNGEGLVGPNLTDEVWIHGCSVEEMAMNIKNGFPSKGMMPYGGGPELSNAELEKLVSYIASLRGTDPANAKAADMSRAKKCNPMEASDVKTSG